MDHERPQRIDHDVAFHYFDGRNSALSAEMITIKSARTSDEIEECFRIRADVFIVEQGVPVDLERDEYDDSALHFLAQSDGRSIGTARAVLKDGGSLAKIGRVAICQFKRGLGVGELLMSAVEGSPELKHVDCFILEAQTHALGFYARLGYEAYGDEFLDAGIPHRRMKKSRNSRSVSRPPSR
jgi:predicted GNAT family N-acyltransferase